MARNPERLAWVILWLAFLAFCAVMLGGWRAADWYLSSATVAREARLEILSGTVLLQDLSTSKEVNVPNNVQLKEGARVRTTAGSQAVIWLFDGSNVRLWPGTSVRVERLRSTSYNATSSEISLRQTAGHLRAEVALPSTRSRRFEVVTPHASALLREGSYGLEVQPQQTELSARYGSATVEAGGHSVEILQRELVTVAEGGYPSDPRAAAWDLIQNGLFVNGLKGWQSGNRDEEEPVPGAVKAAKADDRQCAQFIRKGASKHAETFLYQPIGRDVSDFQRLRLAFDFKLTNQSLSGGGWRGSEYPLMVRVKYRDSYGSEVLWVRGFYYQNEGKLPTSGGQYAPRGEWTRFELDMFSPDQMAPPPVDIISVELSSSGWDYESLVTNVSLLAE